LLSPEELTMGRLSRRTFVYLGLSASAQLMRAGEPAIAQGADNYPAETNSADVQQRLLELAARQERARRATFAAVKSRAELAEFQRSLRTKFLGLIGGLPKNSGAPPVKITGQIEAEDYLIEKLVFESFPGYFVSALLYKPKRISGPLPGILSPCGHATTGKAADEYQILHINLVRRDYVVLTYDPVGQAERSQFWDPQKAATRFNLACGEHAVLGNPLFLLGSSLARYRIWDGMRGLDYLSSLPEVDSRKLSCVGNSGGGTLTAYISALDPRVAVAAICCYITTLPRRMANRIQTDPDADPEQDLYGFVSEGLDHAGLLALRAPRPTLLGSARFDFFPIEGTRESFAEAKRLYEVAGAGERIERVEAAERHGLALPLRKGVYGFFERWLAELKNTASAEEFAVTPRPVKELLVCSEGQVNVTFHSRPLLPLALEEFRRQKRRPRIELRDLLRLDLDQAAPSVMEVAAGALDRTTILILINGNESRDWREEKEFLRALVPGYRVAIVDPRGAGKRRLDLTVQHRDYSDPLVGVEENIAYNAFLVGKSLLGMRVADVLAAIAELTKQTKPERIVLCGRRDAALVACLAAAVDPAIGQVATEGMLLSYLPLFAAKGQPINAASILPGLLESVGDIADVLAQMAPRKVLISAGAGEILRELPSVETIKNRFTADPGRLMEWLQRASR
jgi:cephalosporin-C deacetylase-like acetyl esterase